MKRQEKESIMNGLLSANVISIILSVMMWGIYRGYMHTAYILSMPKIIIAIATIGIIVTVRLVWKLKNELKNMKESKVIYTNKQKKSSSRDLIYKYIRYIVISVIISIGCILIYPYNIIYIYGLWIFIALYLLANIFYSIYLLKIRR